LVFLIFILPLLDTIPSELYPVVIYCPPSTLIVPPPLSTLIALDSVLYVLIVLFILFIVPLLATCNAADSALPVNISESDILIILLAPTAYFPKYIILISPPQYFLPNF
jgi:hypothetical protein